MKLLLLLMMYLSILFLPFGLALTSPYIIQPSPKNTQAGSVTLNTGSYFGIPASAVQQGLLFNLPFSTPMASYQCAIAIQQLHYILSTQLIDVTVQKDFTKIYTTGFRAALFTNVANQIQILVIGYIAYNAEIPSVYWCLYEYTDINSGLVVTNSNPLVITFTGMEPITLTPASAFHSIVTYSGLNCTLADSTNQLDLLVTQARTSPTTVVLTFSTIAPVPPITIYGYNIMSLCYNDNDLLAAAIPATFITGTFSSTSGTSTSPSLPLGLSFNTFWGLTDLHIQKEAFIDFSSSFTPTSIISGTSSNSYLYILFSYIYMQFLDCVSPTPYLMIATVNDTCYDLCPPRYYQDSVNWVCSACPYQCLTCVLPAKTCLTCATSDFRALVGTDCLPITGYYDNGPSSVCLPCDANCLTCATTSVNCLTCVTTQFLTLSNFCSLCDPSCLTCSGSPIKCLTCPNGTYHTVTDTCIACISLCLICTSGTSCSNVTPGYVYNSTQNICVLDCSAITNCATCTGTVGSVTCNLCAVNYILSAGACIPCASGTFYSSGSCLSCDPSCLTCSGTATTCQTCSAAQYLSGSNACVACMAECLNCTSSVSCSLTVAGYVFNSSQTACVLDCSVVTNCLACTGTVGSVNCTYCTANLVVFPVNYGTCIPCTSGTYYSAASCLACSPSCLTCTGTATNCQSCFSAQFLSGSNACVSCMSNCLNCTTVLTCSLAAPGYYFNTSLSQCLPNCTNIAQCATCLPVGNSINCLTCNPGYGVTSPFTCDTICGDGVIMPNEACDDGNFISGDGCSNLCIVEVNFVCNGTQANGASQCYLLSLAISVVSVNKVPSLNTACVVLSLSPAPATMSSVNWTNILQASGIDATVTSATFDPSTGDVSVLLDYGSNIDEQELNLTAASLISSSPMFSLLNPNTSSIKTAMVSSNNAKFGFYSDETYTLASAIESIGTALGVMASVLFLAGMFGGKLIGLEGAAAVQLVYYTLMTQINMAPTMYGLRSLEFSSGYNRVLSQDTSTVPAYISDLQLDRTFLGSFNLTSLCFITPLLVALIFTILARVRPQNKIKYQYYAGKAFGEFTFYGVMFGAYLAFSALAVSMTCSGTIVGIIAGSGTLILAGFYAILLKMRPMIFGEFKQRFQGTGITYHSYSFMVLQRVLISSILVVAADLALRSVGVIAILAAQLIFVVAKKPYSGDRANYRPVGNLVTSIVIQGLYVYSKLDPDSSLSLYVPIGIEICLCAVVGWSTVLLGLQLKQNIISLKQSLETEELVMDETHNARMKRLKEEILKIDNSPLNVHMEKSMEVSSPQALSPLGKIESLKRELRMTGENNSILQMMDMTYFNMNLSDPADS